MTYVNTKGFVDLNCQTQSARPFELASKNTSSDEDKMPKQSEYSKSEFEQRMVDFGQLNLKDFEDSNSQEDNELGSIDEEPPKETIMLPLSQVQKRWGIFKNIKLGKTGF